MIARLFDSIIREPRLIAKYYMPLCFDKKSNRMVFKTDGRFPHGGMFDRLKGAISVFAASQCVGREFKISFTHPFDLGDYLEPNEYDWTIDEGELMKGWPAARPIFMYGEFANPVRLVKMRSCESHFYYGYNSLDWLNDRYGKNFEFGALYKQLFKPTARLQKYIDMYKAEIGCKYIVAHFRFMNLIGDSTEFKGINPTLPNDKQDELIEKSLEQLRRLENSDFDSEAEVKKNGHSQGQSQSRTRIMLCTDSARFMSIVKEKMPDVYIVPGEIKHIGTAEDNSDASTIKMFLDYYLIAEAEKVYNFVSDGMWKSAFSEYAAKIGQKPFERIFY